MEKPLEFKMLEAEIRHVENIEKFIAKKNDKLKFHNRKWKKNYGESNAHIEEYVRQYLEEK